MHRRFPIEVIIPTYNDTDRLSLALWGYTQQTTKDFLIHIVDDGGDGLDDVLAKFPDLHIKYHFLPPKTSKYRPSQARNVAIGEVKSPRVICTDTDIIPSNNLVESHLRFGDDGIVVVGRRSCIAEDSIPRLLKQFEAGTLSYDDLNVIEEDYRIRTKRPWLRFTACSWDAEFDDMNSPIAWDCWSCNISYQTTILKRLGGFSIELDGIWGGEDTELAIRLIKSGQLVACLYDTIGYHLNHQLRAAPGWESFENKLTTLWNDPDAELERNHGLF